MKQQERLKQLQLLMKKKCVSAYIIPTEDFHSSEYVGEYFKSRAFISGFTGSAGTLVVLRDEAALWTDGRYFLQAANELAGSGIKLMKSGQPGVPTIEEYLVSHLKEDDAIGFDGRTISSHFAEGLKEKMPQVAFSGEDLVDEIWQDRPTISKQPVWELEVGESRKEKIKRLYEELKSQGADVLVETSLENIAWLLNLRGKDVEFTPVFLAYLLVEQQKITLFVHDEILNSSIKEKLENDGITIASYNGMNALLRQLPSKMKVIVDKASVNYQLTQSIPESVTILDRPSPIHLMKAKKNLVEMENIRKAHLKDGVAVTKFIYWLKNHAGQVTELEASDKIRELRSEQEGFIDLSFTSIIAYGPHGAIVHYHPEPESDVTIEAKGLLLADTGGHYKEGTTDITRTIVVGPVNEEEKRAFTLVLRGHLNLAAAKFLKGNCGANLDYLARGPLWENGLDYNHGTGHGVGYVLSVHEGPQRLHYDVKRSKNTPFEEGMLITDEPGLYLTDKFGIRHENVLLCREGEKNDYGQFMYFENLTLVPFDREAIEPSLMTKEELCRLNNYHKRVYKEISPYLTDEEAKWLEEATKEM
ncbi:Xaa-Pro aminopeptidase [Lachnospiraceae bacterium TWA4]|nr:Xaa-Pro aminopeptidase [Lachnospiraceae bacterium TWA4]